MSSRRITTKKDGLTQTVNIHIHEKSEKKKRRRRRKKASSSGAIRTLNRFVPASSVVSQGFIPQRRFSQQQLVALPEGSKALGQTGMLGYNVPNPQQMNYQKELLKLAMREYEKEIEGRSQVARDDDIEVIDNILKDYQERTEPPLMIPEKTKPRIVQLKQPKPNDDTRTKLIDRVNLNDKRVKHPPRGLPLYSMSKQELMKLIKEQESVNVSPPPRTNPLATPENSPSPPRISPSGINPFMFN